jgi:hypothetical protein
VGAAAVAGAGGLVALPVTRADGGTRDILVELTVVALLVLVAGLASAVSILVPGSLLLVGAVYAVQLVRDDAPADAAAPAFAAGLLVVAELAYWSLDERDRVQGERGDGLRHLAYVAALGVAAGLVGAVLLAVGDAVRTRGLGIDVAGAVAAALVLLVVVLAGRARGGPGSAGR